MEQKGKMIENHDAYATIVKGRVQQIPQHLQDVKKPRKLEEVQEGR